MKKLLSTLMILTLVLSLAAPVFADEYGKDLSDAERAKTLKLLENYRNIMDIPTDSSDIYIYKPAYYYDENVYCISWDSEPSEYEIYVDDKGNLLQAYIYSYDSYDYYESDKKLRTGGLSKEEGQVIAESFLENIYPGLYKELQLVDVQMYYDYWTYTYTLFKNGIPVSSANATIELNKYNKNYLTFRAAPLIEIAKSTFPEPETVIDEEDAKSIFLENSSAMLFYKNADYFSSEYEETITPWYSLTYESRYLDAVTSESVDEYNPYTLQYRDNYSLEAYKEEITELIEGDYAKWYAEELEGVTGLITQSQAEKAARNKVPQLTSSASLKLAYCRDSYTSGDFYYTWHLFFDTILVQINAMTGELVSFSDYATPATSGNITQEEAQKIASQFIAKEQPTRARQTKLNTYIYEIDYLEDAYIFYYVQNVNDIPFESNRFGLLIDKTGKIIEYAFDWEDNLTFSGVSGVISQEEALDLFAPDCNFSLMYIQKPDETPALVYGLSNLVYHYIDAFTGEKVDPYGSTLWVSATTGYTDIAGKWYEEAVQVLLANGYVIDDSGQFNGGAQITQAEFLHFLYADELYWYDDDEVYDYLLEEGVILEGEIAPDALLTRQDAAKFAARYLGLEKLAQDSSVFKNVYTDSVDPAYAGYAAAAKSLGLMNGDKNGNFNGAQIMTRAEAAVLIYNTLMAY